MVSLARLGPYLRRYLTPMICGFVMLAASAAADLAIPRMTQTVIDKGILQRDLNTILITSAAMIGMTLVSAGLTVGNTVLAVRVSQGVGADLRDDLFQHVQSFSFGNLDRAQTGQLMVRLTSDVMQVLQFVSLLVRMFVRAPLMVLGSLILLFVTNWQLALIMLVLMPSALAIIWLFTTRTQPLFLSVQRTLGTLNTTLQENLAGVRVVKAFVRADHEAARFGTANADLMAQVVRVGRWMALLLPTLRFITSLGTLAIVWLGGLQVMASRLTVGQIVAFNNYVMSTMFPLTNLGMMVGFVAAAAASAKRVFEVLDTQPEIGEPPSAITLPAVRGELCFEDVSFGYNGHEQEPVLSHVSFSALPGETLAILGATGSGKSTLVQLIPRFYDVSKGRISIDGVDIRTVTLESLRRQIGVALQESVLFGATIRENIRYGRPDATEVEVVAAAQAAQAHDFVKGFPDGYDTVVGQRGVTLSGGQKQRLAIARALLIRPAILILDDSTSSVDVTTESLIQNELDGWLPKPTRLVIAQRISTVLHADRIMVLDRGRIAGIGTHAELLATNALYGEIYRSQLGASPKGA